MKLTKKRYLRGFLAVTLLLAVVRWSFPGVAGGEPLIAPDSIADETPVAETILQRPHRIMSVPSYKTVFPDTNSVQLAAAQRWGVKPVKNREDAEAWFNEKVHVANHRPRGLFRRPPKIGRASCRERV